MTATRSTLIAKMQMRAIRIDRIRVCGSDRVLTLVSNSACHPYGIKYKVFKSCLQWGSKRRMTCAIKRRASCLSFISSLKNPYFHSYLSIRDIYT